MLKIMSAAILLCRPTIQFWILPYYSITAVTYSWKVMQRVLHPLLSLQSRSVWQLPTGCLNLQTNSIYRGQPKP